jgi:hypothetical protein
MQRAVTAKRTWSSGDGSPIALQRCSWVPDMPDDAARVDFVIT